MNSTSKAVAAVVAIAATVVLYLVWWWVARDAANRQYDVNTHTQQYQSALVSAERDRITGIQTSISDAQRKSLALTFCSVYPELTQPPPDVAASYSQLCPVQ